MATPLPRRRWLLIAASVILVAGAAGLAGAIGNDPAPASTATPALTITATPAGQVVPRRSTVRYTLRITGRSAGPLRLRLAGRPPRGIRVFMRPERPKRATASIVVHTADARARLHRLRIVAAQAGGQRASTTLAHQVRPSTYSEAAVPETRRSFSISGAPQLPFVPGRQVPIELKFYNPHDHPISVRSPRIEIEGVRPRGDGACSVEDFRVVRQLPDWRFRVPPHTTTRLSRISFGSWRWPLVEMLDRPVNQDGCKGAIVDFSYTGVGTTIRR